MEIQKGSPISSLKRYPEPLRTWDRQITCLHRILYNPYIYHFTQEVLRDYAQGYARESFLNL